MMPRVRSAVAPAKSCRTRSDPGVPGGHGAGDPSLLLSERPLRRVLAGEPQGPGPRRIWWSGTLGLRARRGLGSRHHVRAYMGGLPLSGDRARRLDRRVVRWAIAAHLRTSLVLDAIEHGAHAAAVRGRHLPPATREASTPPTRLAAACRRVGVRPSMGSVGDAHDTPFMRELLRHAGVRAHQAALERRPRVVGHFEARERGEAARPPSRVPPTVATPSAQQPLPTRSQESDCDQPSSVSVNSLRIAGYISQTVSSRTRLLHACSCNGSRQSTVTRPSAS